MDLITQKKIFLEWKGAHVPQRQSLSGHYIDLEPLSLNHCTALYQQFSSEGLNERYAYLPAVPPMSEKEMAKQIESFLEIKDFLFFAVINSETHQAQGHFAIMRIDSANGVAEIGWVLWGPSLVRTRGATEAIFLAVDYLFSLGFRRVEWKCNNFNEASKNAAKRFGFRFEGIFRQHMVVKSENRDTAWFSMLDTEWPSIRQEYQRWLDFENFEVDGKQKSPLRV